MRYLLENEYFLNKPTGVKVRGPQILNIYISQLIVYYTVLKIVYYLLSAGIGIHVLSNYIILK